MDPSQFRRHRPGEIVNINDFGGWAFPEQLWPLLSEVKQRFGVLEGIGKVLPNANLVLRPIRNREAIDSSTMEGTYASAKDMLLMQLLEQKSEGVSA